MSFVLCAGQGQYYITPVLRTYMDIKMLILILYKFKYIICTLNNGCILSKCVFVASLSDFNNQ